MRVDGVTIPLLVLLVLAVGAIYWFGFRGKGR